MESLEFMVPRSQNPLAFFSGGPAAPFLLGTRVGGRGQDAEGPQGCGPCLGSTHNLRLSESSPLSPSLVLGSVFSGPYFLRPHRHELRAMRRKKLQCDWARGHQGGSERGDGREGGELTCGGVWPRAIVITLGEGLAEGAALGE